MTLIDQIRDLIAEGETQRSLDELYKYVKENNADVIDNLVMLRSRMQNLQRAVHNGTMDDQSAALERAKINEAILKLLPQLTPEYLAEAIKRREPLQRPAPATTYEAPAAPARDMKKMFLIGGGALLVVIFLIVMLNRGGGSEENQAQIAADSTATALPNAAPGNATGSQTGEMPQDFQQQEQQTSQAGEDLSAEWQSNNGALTLITDDGTNWSEMGNGVVKFKFKMTEDTEEYVEIYDASRKMTLRIFDDNVKLQYEGESTWNVLAYGGWR
jgi:hypothetical protein